MWNELAGKFGPLEAAGEEDLPAEALSQIFQVLFSFLTNFLPFAVLTLLCVLCTSPQKNLKSGKQA